LRPDLPPQPVRVAKNQAKTMAGLAQGDTDMSREISCGGLCLDIVHLNLQRRTYLPNSELQHTIHKLLSTSPAWLSGTSIFCV